MAAFQFLKIVSGVITKSSASDSVSAVASVSVQTTTFTASTGINYYHCDTTGGAFTATLPSSPNVGDTLTFKDYKRNFQIAALTIDAGSGKTIEQLTSVTAAQTLVLNTSATTQIAGISVTLQYIGSNSWVIV